MKASLSQSLGWTWQKLSNAKLAGQVFQKEKSVLMVTFSSLVVFSETKNEDDIFSEDNIFRQKIAKKGNTVF